MITTQNPRTVQRIGLGVLPRRREYDAHFFSVRSPVAALLLQRPPRWIVLTTAPAAQRKVARQRQLFYRFGRAIVVQEQTRASAATTTSIRTVRSLGAFTGDGSGGRRQPPNTSLIV